ncbi:MAG: general secretion pathway protein GspK [Nitrospirae bacterium]|nr:general secretion pathway protein GspK [Magnetococcales bacterium]
MTVLRTDNQSGMALLVVLGVIALLLPWILHDLQNQRFTVRRVQNELAMQQAYRLAESTLQQVMLNLEKEGGQVFDETRMGGASGKNGEGMTEIEVIDATRYVNINDLVLANGDLNRPVYHLMGEIFEYLHVDISLLNVVVDWMDSDETQMGGTETESSRYQSQGLNYGLANEPMAGRMELNYLPGWNEDLIRRIEPYARVFPGCQYAGINLNNADAVILVAMAEGWNVDTFLQARPFVDLQQMQKAGFPLQAEDASFARFQSSCFAVTIQTQVAEVRGTLESWLLAKDGKISLMGVRWSG